MLQPKSPRRKPQNLAKRKLGSTFRPGHSNHRLRVERTGLTTSATKSDREILDGLMKQAQEAWMAGKLGGLSPSINEAGPSFLNGNAAELSGNVNGFF